MIADVIREAKSEHEIYFLLTAYLEAIHFSDKSNLQPDLADILPITSMEQVRKRFEQSVVELDSASKALDHDACLVLKEGMLIFNTALNRLETLAGRQKLPEHRRRERQVPAGILHGTYIPELHGEIRVDC
jgi:hypothetical protein